MDIKKITLSGVLFAAGLIIHQLMPPILGVTPDVQLAVLFIIILINGTLKASVAAGIVSGIITALTTKFPGGQIPNFLDKLITCVILYLVITFLSKSFKAISEKLKNRNSAVAKALLHVTNNVGVMAIVGLFGTMFSGMIFLTSALYIVGLPSGLTLGIGFLTSVLPAALLNIFFAPLLYKVVEKASSVVQK